MEPIFGLLMAMYKSNTSTSPASKFYLDEIFDRNIIGIIKEYSNVYSIVPTEPHYNSSVISKEDRVVNIFKRNDVGGYYVTLDTDIEFLFITCYLPMSNTELVYKITINLEDQTKNCAVAKYIGVMDYSETSPDYVFKSSSQEQSDVWEIIKKKGIMMMYKNPFVEFINGNFRYFKHIAEDIEWRILKRQN